MLVSSVSVLRLVCPMPHWRSTADHVNFDASAPFRFFRIDLQTYGDPRDSSFGTVSIPRTFAHRTDRDSVVLPRDFTFSPTLKGELGPRGGRDGDLHKTACTLSFELHVSSDPTPVAPPACSGGGPAVSSILVLQGVNWVGVLTKILADGGASPKVEVSEGSPEVVSNTSSVVKREIREEVSHSQAPLDETFYRASSLSLPLPSLSRSPSVWLFSSSSSNSK